MASQACSWVLKMQLAWAMLLACNCITAGQGALSVASQLNLPSLQGVQNTAPHTGSSPKYAWKAQYRSLQGKSLSGQQRSRLVPTDEPFISADSGLPQEESEANHGDLRLVTTSGFVDQGIVQVFLHGEWGGICSRQWDDRDASVACRQLGYAAGRALYGSTTVQGQPPPLEAAQQPVWLSDMQCRGRETMLAACRSGSSSLGPACRLSELAGAYCYNRLRVQLAAGSVSGPGFVSGQLSVQLQDGSWGSVCADAQWRDANAQVACRQLGFPLGGVMQWPLIHPSSPAGSSVNGMPSTGADGSRGTIWAESDVEVSALARDPSSGGQGSHPNGLDSGLNSNIIVDGAGHDAMTAPRSSSSNTTSLPVVLAGVQCLGMEPYLSACRSHGPGAVTAASCPAAQAGAGVYCFTGEPLATSTPPPPTHSASPASAPPAPLPAQPSPPSASPAAPTPTQPREPPAGSGPQLTPSAAPSYSPIPSEVPAYVIFPPLYAHMPTPTTYSPPGYYGSPGQHSTASPPMHGSYGSGGYYTYPAPAPVPEGPMYGGYGPGYYASQPAQQLPPPLYGSYGGSAAPTAPAYPLLLPTTQPNMPGVSPPGPLPIEGSVMLVKDGVAGPDGPSGAWGRIHVFHAGIWGTVCGSFFEANAAAVVCRQLGYAAHGIPLPLPLGSNGQTKPVLTQPMLLEQAPTQRRASGDRRMILSMQAGQQVQKRDYVPGLSDRRHALDVIASAPRPQAGSHLPVWLTDYQCRGSEASLADCIRGLDGWGRRVPGMPCGHDMDMGVWCTSPPPPKSWEPPARSTGPPRPRRAGAAGSLG